MGINIRQIPVLIICAALISIIYHGCKTTGSSSRPPNPYWHNNIVLYGVLKWRTSGFPATDITVEIHTFTFSGKNVKIDSTKTDSQGYFEIILTADPGGDPYVMIKRVSGGQTTKLLRLNGVRLEYNRPNEQNLGLRTPWEIELAKTVTIKEGRVRRYSSPVGQYYFIENNTNNPPKRLVGALVQEVARLGGTDVEIWGDDNGDHFTLKHYVIVDPALKGRLVGRLEINNPVIVTGGSSPGSVMEAPPIATHFTDGEIVVKDKDNLEPPIMVKTSGRRTFEHLLERGFRAPNKIGALAYLSGPMSNGKITVTIYGILNPP